MDLGNQIEIDFHPVGSGEKSGDAITMRFGDFTEGNQFVVVIDGGDKDSGNRIVEHIREHYNSEKVDLVISTHPDSDHTSGLRVVLEEMEVGGIWMHLPWNHSKRIGDLFHDGRITDESLKERLRKAYRYAYELEKMAIDQDIKIYEPFAGLRSLHNIFTILGPSKDYYLELLTDSAKTPEKKDIGLKGGIFESIKTFSAKAISWITETLEQGTLDDSGETSSENNSSAVVLFEFDGKKILFTGDTGIPALNNVLEYCEDNNIDLSDIVIMQVPHHGAQRNISPELIKSFNPEMAVVLASKKAPKHPSYKVSNEFHRNNIGVWTTEGNIINYVHNCEFREGYTSVPPIGFKSEVQE